MRATAQSWQHLPCPERREGLGLKAKFSREDAPSILQGLVPQEMEDKWFIFLDAGWLYFCRSWTGCVIFGLQIEELPTGLRVTDSWVNRDASQYTSQNVDEDRELVLFLIDTLLLRKA